MGKFIVSDLNQAYPDVINSEIEDFMIKESERCDERQYITSGEIRGYLDLNPDNFTVITEEHTDNEQDLKACC